MSCNIVTHAHIVIRAIRCDSCMHARARMHTLILWLLTCFTFNFCGFFLRINLFLGKAKPTQADYVTNGTIGDLMKQTITQTKLGYCVSPLPSPLQVKYGTEDIFIPASWSASSKEIAHISLHHGNSLYNLL